MRVIKGGVTAPKGFLASGVAAGIKKSRKKDLGLIYSEVPAVAAAAFTTNRFQASPIKICKAHLKNGTHQAIIVNSGNANCANGRIGDRDASLMTSCIAQPLGLDKKEVLVASTGIIGKCLPMEKIKGDVADLICGLSKDGHGAFAEAILTTDTRKKELAVEVKIGNAVVKIGGACKGVGMIYPNLSCARHATMLCFMTTDAVITKRMLCEALDEAVDKSFNMISVDGDMSTNDSCFIMANGLAGNKKIDSKAGNYKTFSAALKLVAEELAKELVRDGEGATKFVEIEVTGARNYKDAKIAARKISTSNLLKCCIYGGDPNWGRIVAACGASGVWFNPDKLDVYLGDVKVLSNGTSVKDYDKGKTRGLFKKDDICIKIDLKSGGYQATSWTCDLSREYVAINAEYST